MKPAEFDCVAPTTIDEALEALGSQPDKARVLAGGQSLVALMNLRLASPSLLVDINGVSELGGIAERDGGIVIGAAARQADVERSDLVGSRCPLLVDALRWVSHPQLRNRGTVVGSLVHHDPAAELPAVAVALDATFTVRSAGGGSRSVAARDFFLTHYTTDVGPGELVTEAWFPVLGAGSSSSFVEIARRPGDFALAGVAVALGIEDRAVRWARVAMCAMGEQPVRCTAVEEALVGAVSDGSGFAVAAAALNDAALASLDDIHASARYRRCVAPVLVERALAQAAVNTN